MPDMHQINQFSQMESLQNDRNLNDFSNPKFVSTSKIDHEISRNNICRKASHPSESRISNYVSEMNYGGNNGEL